MSTESLTVGNEPEILIEAVGGDLDLSGVKGDGLEAHSDDEQMQVSQDGKKVTITTGADLKVRVPKGSQVTIEEVDGTASLKDLKGALRINTIVGQISLKNISQASIEGASPDQFARYATRQADRIARQVEREVEVSMQDVKRKVRKAGRKARKWNINWSASPEPKPDPVSEEERMTILRMLADKKITSEEADKLLSALE